MQLLGNFGAKQNFIILYFLIPSLSKIRFCTTEWADIYRCCKQIQHFSKRKLEYFSQHNVLHYECYHCQIKLSAHQIYFSFSKFSYRLNMFWSKNLSPNMPKITSFLLKNCKNRPEPFCLRRLGPMFPDPHISPISLRNPELRA